jgi:hypothetical protein
LPLPPLEDAIAGEFKDVDNSKVIAGGVTTANVPQLARKRRRSCTISASELGAGKPWFCDISISCVAPFNFAIN